MFKMHRSLSTKSLFVTRSFLFSQNYIEVSMHWSWKIVYNQVINEISENASSRKLRNRNWFSQPLVHTVMGRTRALRALVLAHNCMNSWLGKPSSGFPTSWKRYISQLKTLPISYWKFSYSYLWIEREILHEHTKQPRWLLPLYVRKKGKIKKISLFL